MDFGFGENTRKLSKKNVKWYSNKLLEYAHDGLTLDFFLRDYFIRRSSWDSYVKKHKKLQVALLDAQERAKGWMFSEVYNNVKVTKFINPAMLKVMTTNILGWSDKAIDDKAVSDAPPPTINFHQADPLPHQLPGGEVPHLQHLVDEKGTVKKKKGNGKSNGGNGSSG